MIKTSSSSSTAPRPEVEGSDLLKWRGMPSLTMEDAAWLAGITPEALGGFLAGAGIKVASGSDGVARVAVQDLVRGGFAIASRKETQVAMLRSQLHAALEREKSLAQALQLQLGKPAHGWEQGENASEEGKPAVAAAPAQTPAASLERSRKSKKR